MNTATLRIYNSIEDQEPSKTYTCYRTTMAINNKLEELTEEVNEFKKEAETLQNSITKDTTEEELEKIKGAIRKIEEKMNKNTLEVIRLFFPNFSDEEFLKLDPYDYQTFVFEIGEMRNKIYNRAAKN